MVFAGPPPPHQPLLEKREGCSQLIFTDSIAHATNVSADLQTQKLSRALEAAEAECRTFADGYAKYEYLWAKDIEECFQEFKLKETDEYKALSPEDLEKGVAPSADAVPSLARFDEEIAKYQAIQDEVATLPNSQQVRVLSFKGSDHCLSSFCFSAFPCGSTELAAGARHTAIDLLTPDGSILTD
eukprot:SAG22_NODE_38_length_26325_cov_107.302067_11_plen_185_part_00